MSNVNKIDFTLFEIVGTGGMRFRLGTIGIQSLSEGRIGTQNEVYNKSLD